MLSDGVLVQLPCFLSTAWYDFQVQLAVPWKFNPKQALSMDAKFAYRIIPKDDIIKPNVKSMKSPMHLVESNYDWKNMWLAIRTKLNKGEAKYQTAKKKTRKGG